MKKMNRKNTEQMHFIPGPYFQDFIPDISDAVIKKYGLAKVHYAKGQELTTPGTINNTAWFYQSGMVHVALTNSAGNSQSLVFYGPDTIFPVGVFSHENLIDYQMEITAMTEVDAICIPYLTLRQMVLDDSELGLHLLEEDCQFIGYFFYSTMNRTWLPSRTQAADVLWLLYTRMEHRNNGIAISQERLASLIGLSHAQTERVLKDFRKEGILKTSRGKLFILDEGKLLSACSDDMQYYAERMKNSKA